jgi:hypothetical protein
METKLDMDTMMSLLNTVRTETTEKKEREIGNKIGITRKSHEETKKHRKMAKKSRKINRRK